MRLLFICFLRRFGQHQDHSKGVGAYRSNDKIVITITIVTVILLCLSLYVILLIKGTDPRQVLHTLFDDGYIAMDRVYRIAVRQRLHDDYGNGKDYYKYHGWQLLILPESALSRPSPDFIDWQKTMFISGRIWFIHEALLSAII